jgi:hypothetical protein
VAPPAQLLCVPATLTYSRIRLPSASTSMFVVPPRRSAGDALPPEGPVDPVCDLGIAINDEAGDAADEPSIDADRTGGHLRRRPELRHVDIECGAVIGIFGREGGHPDRLGIPHLFEQGIEVGVVDRPQRHLSHKYPPTLVQRR